MAVMINPSSASAASTASTAPVTFRRAVPQDVPAVVALVESAYRGEVSRIGWTSEAGLLGGQRTDDAAVLQILADSAGILLLAERDGELLGCCQLEHRDDGAYFGMFSVRPSAQGAGIGGQVITEAERLARAEWGVRSMEMTVIRQRAELIAWYERRGYRDSGERSPFPYGNERFGVPKVSDLEFTKLIKPL
jgi:ribosomal protein S18 acetylase RimI-like enzyme